MIVIGVLVALAVDSWASDRADRVLEQEYLQRLLDDVRFDLEEFAFLGATNEVGIEAGLALTEVETLDDIEASRLVALVGAVANERQPDLSRATYRELLSAGRLDLIQAREVREALAEYDRSILESQGLWDALSPHLMVWARSRIPLQVLALRDEACSVEGAEWMFTVYTICEFDLGGWSVDNLREDVQTVDAQQRFRLSTHRFGAGIAVLGLLRDSARDLEAELERALGETR